MNVPAFTQTNPSINTPDPRQPSNSKSTATHRQDAELDFSLVITLNDEESNVTPLLDEIAATFQNAYDYEIVCVDDGSRDGTLDALRQAAARHRNLVVIRHAERCGKSAGVRTGAEMARAPLLLLMDGDLQNDPADALRLLAMMAEGRADDPDLAMVAGQRLRRVGSIVQRHSSSIANRVRRAALKDGTRDTGCGLKVITRDAFLAMPFFDGQHRFMSALVRAQGHSIALCDVNDRPRIAGESKSGVWNRLWVGIGDLLAISWLLHRRHLPSRIERVVDPAEDEIRETADDNMA